MQIKIKSFAFYSYTILYLNFIQFIKFNQLKRISLDRARKVHKS